MSTTRRSSDCPRCLKRVKLVGSRGVMPRHIDPATRKVCESAGYSPSDAAAHVRTEAAQERARLDALARWVQELDSDAWPTVDEAQDRDEAEELGLSN